MQAAQVHQAAASERKLSALPSVLQAASASLPAESSVFLPWAVERCALADGYIPATAQEVLLWLFLGEREAAQLVHRGRAHTPPPPPGHPNPASQSPAPRDAANTSAATSAPAITPVARNPGSGAVQNRGRDQRGP